MSDDNYIALKCIDDVAEIFIIIIVINVEAADILPPSDWEMLRNKRKLHNWGNKSADWSNLLIF